MPAILRRHVNFGPGEADLRTGDTLLQPGELTSAEAAVIAECTTERIRQLVKQYRLGRWEPRLRMYVIDAAKLTAHLARRRKRCLHR
jgi:hypothetical protein